MTQNKQIYSIIHITGFDMAGDNVKTVASRYCTPEEINKEVDYLNKVVNGVSVEDNFSWNYFAAQLVKLTPEKTFNKLFDFSKFDEKLGIHFDPLALDETINNSVRKKKDAQLFTIINIEAYDCEGQTTLAVGSRYCTKEEIEREVEFLNKNIQGVSEDYSSHSNYFTYKNVKISPEGKFKNNFTFSSTDDNLNLQGIKNIILHDFDRVCSHYHHVKEYNPEKPFKDYLDRRYFDCINDKTFFYQDFVELVKNFSKEGLIKSDISKINFYENEPSLEQKLSTKFKMKP